MSIYKHIFERDEFQDKPALIDPLNSKILVFRQFASLVKDAVDQLQPYVSKGEVVSICMPNSLEFVVAFFAINHLSAVAAPLNPAYTKDEFAFFMNDPNRRLVIIRQNDDDENSASLRKAAQENGIGIAELSIVYETTETAKCIFNHLSAISSQASKDFHTPFKFQPSSDQKQDVALLLHTSGTTGKPKAVPLSNLNLILSFENIKKCYSLNPNDRSLCVMPLFHIHGLVAALLSQLAAGGCVVIPPRFSAKTFWTHYQEFECSWFTAVPTILQVLLNIESPKNPNVRLIRSCSSALANGTLEQLQEKFVGVPIIEAYAMTEAAHQMTTNYVTLGSQKKGSVGVCSKVMFSQNLGPPNNSEYLDVQIFSDEGAKLEPGNTGEICIRGKQVFSGYLNNPEANATSFISFQDKQWFRTGDLGFLDSNGFLTVSGRIKEIINRGGEKIMPLEIDNALLKIPGVVEAISFGVKDNKYGETPEAIVVLADDAKGKLSQEKIKELLSNQIAKFKVPERIHIENEIPKAATGKSQRSKIAQNYSQN